MSAGDPDEDFFREVEGRREPKPSSGERPDEPRGKRRKRSFFEDLLDFE